MPGADFLAFIGHDVPQKLILVVVRGAHFGFEVDMRAQAKSVRHMIGIGADVGMTRKLLRPVPFLLQLVVEAIGVLHAFHVATGAGIAVPVPSAAHAVTAFEAAGGEALFAQAMQQIETREAGPHDDCINDDGINGSIGGWGVD